jgi:transposase
MGCSVCGAADHNERFHKRTCTDCGGKGHNARTCRKRTADMAELDTVAFDNKRRRSCGLALGEAEVDVMTRCYLQCVEEQKQGFVENLNDPVERTVKLTGAGRPTIYNKIKKPIEDGQWPEVDETATMRGKYTRKNRDHGRDILGKIRQQTKLMQHAGCMVTLPKLRKRLDYHYGILVSLKALRRLLQKMGYKYRRPGCEQVYIEESSEIKALRKTYISKVQKARVDGYYPIFIDESYVNHHHVSHYSWVKDGDKVKLSKGKGNRWIMFHAIGAKGWVSGADKIFKAKSTEDYHDGMNAKHFSEMFENVCQVSARQYGKCCIVMDNAAYHTTLVDDKAKISFWRAVPAKEIKDMWARGEVPGSLGLDVPKTKKSILETVKANLDKNPQLKVESIASGHGHIVARLPPYHPDLNPIETAWGITKNYVANENYTTGITFENLKVLISRGMEKVSPCVAEKLVNRVIRKEQAYMCIAEKDDEDRAMARDKFPDFVFSLESSDEESDDEDMEDDELTPEENALIEDVSEGLDIPDEDLFDGETDDIVNGDHDDIELDVASVLLSLHNLSVTMADE